MKRNRSLLPLTLHGLVSLLLPIPCFLIIFVVNAFLSLLVPGSTEAGAGTFVGILIMLVPSVFCLSGIYRGIRRLRRRRRSKRAITCLALCGLGLIEFIALLVYMLNVRL